MATLRTAPTFLALLALSAGAAAAQAPTTITVSPRLPTTLDRIEATVSGTACQDPSSEPARVEAGRVILPVVDLHSPVCFPFPFSETFSFGPLPAGTWTLQATLDGEPGAQRIVDVETATTELFLQNGKFRVQVEWSAPGGALHGDAIAVPLSDEAGHLWFFQGSNPEILVKILDGRPVNGHWWVFISSNTNLEFTVHVEIFPDIITPPGVFLQTYVSPAGANKNFIDTETFEDR